MTDSDLSLEFLRVVEQAAIACAHTMGQGDRHKSDQVAVEAMRRVMLTAIAALFFNYLGYHSVVVDLFVYASLAITLISSLHYIRHAARIIDAPA